MLAEVFLGERLVRDTDQAVTPSKIAHKKLKKTKQDAGSVKKKIIKKDKVPNGKTNQHAKKTKKTGKSQDSKKNGARGLT